uniref:Receptor expression-enhancing protein n=1 Tax=Favella ehrenbergii TaxID=182087 RepID=A0A7S3I5I5_9SPIT|eukprot:CAMPEP_0170461226 /NCGR_PEP_ID=MMETSP0123-20130129/7219_1 /TAXON_ID=182087 /ORGANISM="Favella ehrenbergii, Strain Fehren 1" /LENGTH=219 /DNA_ID=CAMNT_0010726209 /DNA_START=44 /DNA_END=703 /DNA_ORIENTATION=+
MDQVKGTLQKNTSILDPYAAMVPALVDLAQKAGVNPGLILAGVGSVAMLILLVIQGWTILLTSVTVLYPAIHSIRAIESDGKDDDKVWLTYWMVFGLFNVAETFFGFVFYFIPYWDWLRLVLFIWLLLPQFNGSKVLYETVIRKLLDQNKDLIEMWISKVSSAATEVKKQGLEQAKAAASDPTLIAQGVAAASAAQAKINEASAEDAPVQSSEDPVIAE